MPDEVCPEEFLVQRWTRAEIYGTLRATPESKSRSNENFEATRVEEIELPDGTEARLRYLEPITRGGTQGGYWEGKFDKRGTTYTLTITSEEVTENAVKQALSTIVSVQQGGSSGKTRAKEDPTPQQREQEDPSKSDQRPPTEDKEKVPPMPEVPNNRDKGAEI